MRELKNVVQRAFILAAERHRRRLAAGCGVVGGARSAPASRFASARSIDEAERRLILATLEHCAGDKKKAAELLGISLKTLYNRLNVYNA